MRSWEPNAIEARYAVTTRARVIEGGVADGVALGERVALELGGEDAKQLLKQLRVVLPVEPFHCMCLGDWGVELYVRDRRVVTIGLHHGRSLRVDGWRSDAMLADGEGLLRFLAERGLAEPLAAFEEDRRTGERFAKARERWLAAVPPEIAPVLASLEGHGPGRHLRPGEPDVVAALAKMNAPARSLLRWYGSALGPWSGFPSYETVAEALLKELGVEPVIAAAEETSDESELFAAARFIGRFDAPPKERRLLSAELAARLRAVTDRLGDDDARKRIAAALRPLEVPKAGPCIGRSESSRDFAAVVATDAGVVALDGPELVLLGAERRVIAADLARVGAVAAWGHRVVLTLLDRAEVVAVDVTTGAQRTLAEDVPEARHVAALGERVVWMEKRGNSYVVRDRERKWGKEHVPCRDLHLVGDAPVWDRAVGSWWGTDPGFKSEVVTVTSKGKLTVLTRARGSQCAPRFNADARRVVTFADHDATLVSDGRERSLGLERRIEHATFDGDTLWAIALSEDRWQAELLRIDLVTGAVKSLLQYRRALYYRERLSVAAGRVVWNAGGEAFSVATSPDTATA